MTTVERLPGACGRALRTSARLARRLWRLLVLMVQVAQERRLMRALDDRMLADLGLSREALRREARRSVWDVPAERLNRRPHEGDCQRRR